MFAIYCDGGQWLITENGQDDNERFVYAACKWQALQMPSKEVAQAVLKRVRAHGVGAWLVPVAALGLDVQADKMTREELRAVTAMADTLIEQDADYYAAKSASFKAAARHCLRWLVSQDAGGVLLPVFEAASNKDAQDGQTWAGLKFFSLKASQRDYLERKALGLQCQKFAGVAA